MNENSILEMLKQRQGNRTRSELAREIGISPQYLHDVFNGRRGPGPKILAFLNIERRETYVRVPVAR